MKGRLESRAALKRSHKRITDHWEMPNLGRGNERDGIKICSENELEAF